MILNNEGQTVVNNLESESAQFEIAANAKMFDILSSKIYEDIPRAIVRELSCNAIDANIDAGIEDPFSVYLPTSEFPSLIVEDNGVGMTHEDVMEVYRSYGKSTKSASNKVIGALGLGGKTPLAYTQQFVLETSKNGEKNSYIIFRDENGIPNVTRVNSEKCDQSGTKVEVNLKHEDWITFNTAAAKTFLFFDKMPILKRGEDFFYRNLYTKFISSYSTPATNEIKALFEQTRKLVKNNYVAAGRNEKEYGLLNAIIRNYNAEYGVVMGQIFYKVNAEQTYDRDQYKEYAEKCFNFPANHMSSLKKIIRVNLGEVSFQPSREVLSYSQNTIKTLRSYFYKDFIDFAADVKANYNTPVKFLKNFDDIPNSKFIWNVTETDNPDLKFMHELNKGTRQLLVKVPQQSFAWTYFCRRRRGRTFEMANLTSMTGFDNYSETFFEELLNKKSKIFVIDEPVIKEKVENFENKMKAKGTARKFFTLPVALTHKLNTRGDDSYIIMDKHTFDNFKKVLTVQFVESSSIKIVKAPKTPVEREKKERIAGGRCYDMTSQTYIDFNTAMKLASKDNVSWEMFEGDPKVRGWFYLPNWTELAKGEKLNKEQSIIHTVHGRWNGCEGDRLENLRLAVSKFKAFTSNFKRHFLIDLNFYKKYNVENLKNWYFIDEAVIIDTRTAIKIIDLQIRSMGAELPNAIQDSGLAKYILEVGNKIFGSKFDQTLIAQECNREIAKVNQDNDFDSYTRMVNRIANNALMSGHKEWPKFNQHEAMLKGCEQMAREIETARNIVKKTTNNTTKVDEVFTAYPMLKYMNLRSLNREYAEDIVTYVGMVHQL